MPRAPGPRRQRGRYAPRYDPVELLTIVREITFLVARAAGVDPLQVTTRAYDAARASSPYPDSPRADRIAGRFGASWRRVVEVAHLRGRAFQQALVALTRREMMPFTSDEAAAAVRAVAAKLGASTLRPAAYNVELDRLVEAQRRAWLHGRRVWDDYPSAERIDALYGWNVILAQAGLEPLPTPGARSGQQPRWTWTCTRCVQSLLTALEEYTRERPGELLTQRAYQRLKRGRSDLAPASAIADAARLMGTTFSELRRELLAWRLGTREETPSCLLFAARVDEEQQRARALRDPLEAARAAQRELSSVWEEELLGKLREIGRPVSCGELADALGWRAQQVTRRLQALRGRGRVTMTRLGRGNKTARWSAAPQSTPASRAEPPREPE